MNNAELIDLPHTLDLLPSVPVDLIMQQEQFVNSLH